jgi:hypothetical protein
LQNGFVLFVDHGFHRDSGGRERLGPEGKKHRLLLLIVVATPMSKSAAFFPLSLPAKASFGGQQAAH